MKNYSVHVAVFFDVEVTAADRAAAEAQVRDAVLPAVSSFPSVDVGVDAQELCDGAAFEALLAEAGERVERELSPAEATRQLQMAFNQKAREIAANG
jgi:hypothetical protein